MEMLKLMSFKRLYWQPSQMQIVSFNLSNDYPDWLPSKVNCTLYGIGWQSCTSLHDVEGWAAISSGGNCKMPNDDAVWEHEFARERVILFFFQPYSKTPLHRPPYSLSRRHIFGSLLWFNAVHTISIWMDSYELLSKSHSWLKWNTVQCQTFWPSCNFTPLHHPEEAVGCGLRQHFNNFTFPYLPL